MYMTNNRLRYVIVQHDREMNSFLIRAKFGERDESEWYCKNVMKNMLLHDKPQYAIRLLDVLMMAEIDLFGEYQPLFGEFIKEPSILRIYA